MTRNLLVGLAVILVAAVIGIWLANNTHWEEVDVPARLKGEAATNPFYALQHLSEALGVHTQVRHEVLGVPAAKGVIVLDFWNWDIIPERRQRLEQWVSAGGRLVVNQTELRNDGFRQWSGVKRIPEPESARKAPLITAPLKGGLSCGQARRLTSATDSSERFDIDGFLENGLTTTRKYTWRLLDQDGKTQALRIPIGRGSVTVLNTYNLSNLNVVMCGDYGVLFAAATQMHRGDQITFLTENRGGSLLGLIWQYGAPVVVLAAVFIALWLWRSAVRFGPLVAPTDAARRSLAEQIRGTGQFTLRFGGGAALYAATVRALNEVATRKIPQYGRSSASERVTALEAMTGVAATDLTRALENQAMQTPKEIRKTIALLEAARRRLVAATK